MVTGHEYTREVMNSDADGAGVREFITFKELNRFGEMIQIELTRIVADNKNKRSLPNLWYRHKFTDRVLPSFISVTVYATDADGNCWGRYNPTLTKAWELNFDWVLEDTKENRQRIIAEVERLAFGG